MVLDNFSEMSFRNGFICIRPWFFRNENDKFPWRAFPFSIEVHPRYQSTPWWNPISGSQASIVAARGPKLLISCIIRFGLLNVYGSDDHRCIPLAFLYLNWLPHFNFYLLFVIELKLFLQVGISYRWVECFWRYHIRKNIRFFSTEDGCFWYFWLYRCFTFSVLIFKKDGVNWSKKRVILILRNFLIVWFFFSIVFFFDFVNWVYRAKSQGAWQKIWKR